MARQSWTIAVSFIILFVFLAIGVFVLMQNQAGFVFAIPALWGILLPTITFSSSS